jgi:hypothetical protein
MGTPIIDLSTLQIPENMQNIANAIVGVGIGIFSVWGLFLRKRHKLLTDDPSLDDLSDLVVLIKKHHATLEKTGDFLQQNYNTLNQVMGNNTMLLELLRDIRSQISQMQQRQTLLDMIESELRGKSKRDSS